jgi:hypothetical protein
VSKPASKQRTVLGCQIRWVAGLFSLLMFVAGAIPAYASEFNPEPHTNPDVFLAADLHEGLAQDDGYCSSDDLLSFNSTNLEIEIEKEATDASASTGAFSQAFARMVVRVSGRDERSQRSGDVSGRLFSRAPPLV